MKMPLKHRLMTLRDDVVFVVFLPGGEAAGRFDANERGRGDPAIQATAESFRGGGLNFVHRRLDQFVCCRRGRGCVGRPNSLPVSFLASGAMGT